MTNIATTERPPAERPKSGAGLFRAFWRWHFYASFLVIPILLALSVSGMIYLLRFQLDPIFTEAMSNDLKSAADYQTLRDQEAAVKEAYDGAVVLSVSEPRQPGDNTRFVIATAEEAAKGLPPLEMASTDVYVNPATAEVAGEVDPTTTLSGWALRLHSELLMGPRAERVIELAACWALVMALTGYYLFWKGRKGRARRVATGSEGAKLRSRHALVGAVVGVSILGLVVSGLPWTGFWGEKVQELASDRGSSLWSLDPGATSDVDGLTMEDKAPEGHEHETSWAQGESEVPESELPKVTAEPVSVDVALAAAKAAGAQSPMSISYPGDETGVYSIATDAFHDPSKEATIHIDQYSGEVAAQYGFEDYPLLAKLVSQGIGLHEGRSLGWISFWGALLGCLLILFLCVSGPLMWWKRRPAQSGSIGAPTGSLPIRSTPWLLAALVVLGIFLPFFGVSLLAILILDYLVLRRVPRLAGVFNKA